uniref:GAF domain-containing protein n=1 Tax=Acidobacterium capsulatum TaxID=33075 RepID=A0A7V4XQR9_9BACT
MKTRTNLAQALFRGLAVLCILAGLSYWVSGLIADWDWTVHASHHVREPFGFDSDSLAVTSVKPEAAKAGLKVGDKIVSLDGVPYHGQLQWNDVTEVTPGTMLFAGYRSADGKLGTAAIQLRPEKSPLGKNIVAVLTVFFGMPLICLLLASWVLFARPGDRNAWLLYFLLAFPSVMYYQPGNWPSQILVLQLIWYQMLQFFGILCLLLFGVYFPERSRIDIRFPWLKYLIIVPMLGIFVILAPLVTRELVSNGNPAWLTTTANYAKYADNALNLLCVLGCLALMLDKLRAASSPDTRRRMRVLLSGMSVGLGSLLIVFILLPDLGVNLGAHGMWLIYVGTAFFTFAPASMVYVVLVERAMDVRVLVRAGTRYLLARTGIWVAQTLLIVAAAYILVVPHAHTRGTAANDWIGPAIFVALVLGLRFVARKRAREWLDRKFFREAYNAEQVMTELSEEVLRFTETQPLLETVVRRIADTLHVENIALLLRSGESFQLQQAIGLPMDGTLTLTAHSSAVRRLALSNEPARLSERRPDAWYLMADSTERQTLDGLHAEVLLPVPGRQRLMGVMALGSKKSEAAYSKSDLRLLQMVASQTGLALEVSELVQSLAHEAAQRERTQREIEIAREVQERLFPQDAPSLLGGSLAGFCRPAQGVGGDYYDMIQLRDGRIGIAIGDVSGKGISAALLMASLRASLRGLTLATHNNFACLMEQMNGLVYEASAQNRYATFFFGAFDPKTRELECVNAGHNPPLILRGDKVISIEASGPVVGLLPKAQYTEQRIPLEAGDLLLLYTDGISEAMTAREEEWGEERMIEAAREAARGSAAQILGAILQAADRFTAGAPQHDDMTLLVLKCEAE